MSRVANAPPVGTVSHILARWSEETPAAHALLSTDRAPMSFADLDKHRARVARALADRGLSRHHRLATVLPDGPEAATAFLAMASCATVAPLNPAYRAADFEFYLADLRATALIVPEGGAPEAQAVALARSLPLLELRPDPRTSGAFDLLGPGAAPPCAPETPGPDDIALLLHTSGTTSRPKIVPLTQRNLSASARHIAATLALSPNDRCLCVMPLFHIHGLIGALLASLSAGASVIAAPGFRRDEFFGWIDRLAPNWYSAVPTMHQAILGAAGEHADIIRRRPLRLIRSSSAALPPQVMAELESVFSAPVIESYGMTEAAHQMASNPLPPRPRKPGSVGTAAGPEIAILDNAGAPLPAGATGEIAIRGPNVTPGYENNDAANAGAFTRGWFRTGDQGYLDEDGYLFITGRLKELINRGGEKIAPREIDEALLAHPGVRQAVAFPVPHPSLGEDVAAAVVAKDDAQLNEASLREFAFGRLPPFKVPTRIIIVDDIPKGPTGKIQRIGLAKKLDAALAQFFEPPSGETEALVASTFADVLHLERVGRNENFFFLGGDSLRATQVTSRLGARLGLDVQVIAVFHHPTPASLAPELDRLCGAVDIADLAAELEKLPPEERDRILDELSRESP